MGRKQITFWLDDYQFTLVKTLAARREMGVSEYIRWLCAADADDLGLEWPGPVEDTRGTYDRLATRLADVFISVSNGCAHVARSVNGQEIRASNWEALEDQALAEVEAQGGFATLSAIYECSQELAKQAVWE